MRPKVMYGEYTIRFVDCDPLGHLYNGTYIKYFQNAREDQITANYGLDLNKIAIVDRVAWVVVQNQIGYLRPAHPNEKVQISSCLFGYNERFIDVEMIMWNHDKTRIKSLLWAKFGFVDTKTGKSKAHDEFYMNLFSEVHKEGLPTLFEERSAAARQFNKGKIDNWY